MHVLVFFLIIIVAVFVMALAAIGNVLRAIFGLGRRGNTSATNGQQRQHQYNSNSQQSQHTQAKGEDNKKHGKVFTEDEGEYVDFEEIKD